MEKANLGFTHLQGTTLQRAFFDSNTLLNNAILCDNKFGGVSIADIQWGNVNVTVIDWSAISILGDERRVKQRKDENGEGKGWQDRLDEYQTAVRAYRQLSVVLKTQGLDEEAARFVYRSRLLHQKVLWMQRKFVQYSFSLFLYLLMGFGFKPSRSFITYLVVNIAFAIAYYLIEAWS